NACRTGDPAGLAATRLLLRRMALGGICDHLGGGFARYATDAEWLVPHFEKMLYDNAQLLDLLALAHAAAPDPLYAARAAETVRWLDRDMSAEPRDGRAAFAASEDADSEGEEGRFYVWTEAEIDAALGPDSATFKTAYDVTTEGNWEGRTILRRVTPAGDAASEATLARSRDRLFAVRAGRPRPGRDDKVLADWNGLAITALCRAAAVFARPDWRERAAAAFGFIQAEMTDPDGRVRHAWGLGRISAAGLLDDHAALARAALALFEATGETRYLDHAIRLAECVEHWFGPSATGYFTTAADAADLPLGPAARPRTATDAATPAGNGLMAEVLARLHLLTGEPHWRARADALLAAFGGLGDQLGACPTLLAAADLLENGAVVVVTGAADSAPARALATAALAAPDPAVCLLRAPATEALPTLHPAHGKPAPNEGAAAAYVCRAGTCSLPLTDPPALAATLRTRTPTA
ncbi:MAG TPA: thioredoxin domain-containing protein, partial [Acetobacteraceae bacterium]|nr:thioredoxin domain-containing protein [Acetobacteraceae bacterium]